MIVAWVTRAASAFSLTIKRASSHVSILPKAILVSLSPITRLSTPLPASFVAYLTTTLGSGRSLLTPDGRHFSPLRSQTKRPLSFAQRPSAIEFYPCMVLPVLLEASGFRRARLAIRACRRRSHRVTAAAHIARGSVEANGFGRARLAIRACRWSRAGRSRVTAARRCESSYRHRKCTDERQTLHDVALLHCRNSLITASLLRLDGVESRQFRLSSLREYIYRLSSKSKFRGRAYTTRVPSIRAGGNPPEW
jgi:hypothetical protein